MSELTRGIHEQIEALNGQLMQYLNNQDRYDALIEEMKAAGYEVTLPGTLDFHGCGGKDMLLDGLKILRRNGYVSREIPAKKATVFAAFFNSEDLPDSDDPNHEPLRVWFSFSSTVCRRVLVGTEMREVEIYEVRCGDESESDEPF